MPGGPFRAKVRGTRNPSSDFAPTVTAPPRVTSYTDQPLVVSVGATGKPAPTITITGSLPTGLNFADLGGGHAYIAGYPTVVGVTTVTVTATNTQGTDSQDVTFELSESPVDPPDPTAPVITTPNTVSSPEDVGLFFVVSASGDPVPAMSLLSGTLPTGLTFTDAGGGQAIIGGVPTTPGQTSVTVRASNSGGHDDQVLTITVTAANTDIAPVIESGALLQGMAGVPLIFTLTASGFPTPTVTVAGSLPSGLTYVPTTGGGVIAGTPATSFLGSVTVKATNRAGTVSQTLTIGIVPAVVLPGHTHTLPSNIDRTGTVDVTGALQSFIESVPNGTASTPEVIRFPAGTYIIDQLYHGHPADNGNVANKTPIKRYTVFDGSAGAILKRTSNPTKNGVAIRDYPMWVANLGTGLVWYGLEFTANNSGTAYQSAREAQHALDLSGLWDSEVSNCTFHHLWGDGCFVSAGGGRGYTPRQGLRTWIHDNESHNNGRQGLALVGGLEDVVAEDNWIHDGRRTAIDVEPLGSGTDDLNTMTNIHLLTNRIEDNQLTTVASKGGATITNFVVKGNYGHSGEPSFYFGSALNVTRTGLWFHDNDFSGGQDMAHPFPLVRYLGVSVRNNTIPVQSRLYVPPDGSSSVQNPFVYVNASQMGSITVTGNTISPSSGGQYYQDTRNRIAGGSPISSTPPAPPVCGAPFARRSTGGWTP